MSLATPSEVTAALAAKATLVDLRSADEFAEEPMLPGSLHVPWDSVNSVNGTMGDVSAAEEVVVLY